MFFKLTLMIGVVFSAMAFGLTLDTRIANDYALFDEITSITLLNEKTIAAELKVAGTIAARKCQYTNFAVFLRPGSSEEIQHELYDVTLHPVYQNPKVEVSITPCSDLSLSPQSFDTTFKFTAREWSNDWKKKQFTLNFLGTGGVVVKKVVLSFTPSHGWVLEK